MFKTYKNEVSLRCEKFIKCLRSDSSGEYYDHSILRPPHYPSIDSSPIHYDKMVWPKEIKEF